MHNAREGQRIGSRNVQLTNVASLGSTSLKCVYLPRGCSSTTKVIILRSYMLNFTPVAVYLWHRVVLPPSMTTEHTHVGAADQRHIS